MSDIILSLSNIRKSYGRHEILKDFNLEVEENDIIALCGHSGCGKSTLLNILGLLEPFDAGTYTIFGKAAPKVDSRAAQKLIRDEICYLFQNFALVDDRSVKDNLEMATHHIKQTPKEKLSAMQNALCKVGLKDYLDAKVFELSGGEQQRVSLARCLLKPGKLLLADEPTGSLDDKNRDEVIGILKNFNASGKTIIIVTHDPAVASACNRIERLD
ncbi:MAG: putative bacteriocin export ABC transporter [Coriobacteriales bacterium]|jgi:putative ABC transport system ATP-binding protein|nr:putative bacteriocin export ABC transporter [Coriobacteriales bacterium]